MSCPGNYGTYTGCLTVCGGYKGERARVRARAKQSARSSVAVAGRCGSFLRFEASRIITPTDASNLLQRLQFVKDESGVHYAAPAADNDVDVVLPPDIRQRHRAGRWWRCRGRCCVGFRRRHSDAAGDQHDRERLSVPAEFNQLIGPAAEANCRRVAVGDRCDRCTKGYRSDLHTSGATDLADPSDDRNCEKLFHFNSARYNVMSVAAAFSSEQKPTLTCALFPVENTGTSGLPCTRLWSMNH